MPSYFGFQLALELTNIFPVKTIVNGAAIALMEYAQRLKKSGSDICVEADLVEIFGRGKLDREILDKFQRITKVEDKIQVIHEKSSVVLHRGPGPTMKKAFQDQLHMATVIQLSFLAWTHNRDELSTKILNAVGIRREGGIGIDDSLDFEGIKKVLATVSAQTCDFNWSYYSEQVLHKILTKVPEFTYLDEHRHMPPSLFLAGMDFLYAVQSLPEDRHIVVSSDYGIVPFVLWAHYILGLNVALTGSDKTSSITFGDERKVQVTIKLIPRENGDYQVPPLPEIRLLDATMNVLLEVHPTFDDAILPKRASERHILLGWGSVYLYRLINRQTLVPDNHSLYTVLASCVTAFACYISNFIMRTTENTPEAQSLYMDFETWRILDCAELMFDGIKLDREMINDVLNEITSSGDANGPAEKKAQEFIQDSPWRINFRNEGDLHILAEIVLSFGCVIGIKECAKLPVRIGWILKNQCEFPFQYNYKSRIMLDDTVDSTVNNVHGGFEMIAWLTNDQPNGWHRERTSYRRHFLVSDFGWSVYLSTFATTDPANISPELLYIKQGTPKDLKTGEIKRKLKDGSGFRTNSKYVQPQSTLIEGPTEISADCCLEVAKLRELWSSRTDEFECTIHYVIKELGAITHEPCIGYADMRELLWRVRLTPVDVCRHEKRNQSTEKFEIKHGTVFTPNFLSHAIDIRENVKTVVTATGRDIAIRWLMIVECPSAMIAQNIMLRRRNACIACSVSYVESLNGKWCLIL